MKNKLKSKGEIGSRKRILPHVAFFLFRILTLLLIIIFITGGIYSRDIALGKSDEVLYIYQFNLFQLYLVCSAIINGNIFGYYLSIILMVNNVILSVLILIGNNRKLNPTTQALTTVFIASFGVEATISLCLIYSRRNESNFQLFKKIGADQEINEAFSTRKLLESFGPLNFFIASVISMKLISPPKAYLQLSAIFAFIFTFLTYAQQLYITIGFNDERPRQRAIAIGLSIIRIPFIIVSMVLFIFNPGEMPNQREQIEVFCYLVGDIVVLAIFMVYVLIKDTKMFGSGLKEVLKFKTRKINLSLYK